MTKLSDRRIAYVCREAAKGRGGESLRSMAARWGVTARHLRRLVQKHRETGTVPTLNPNRRPKGPPLTEDQKRVLDEQYARFRQGASKIHKELAKQGVDIPKHKIHAYFRLNGYTAPNPRKQKKRSRCRYEREHSGSLLHGDWHRTTEQHPHVILWEDDASRFVLAGGEFQSISAESSMATFLEAVNTAKAWNLDIRQVNTDRDSCFYANEQEGKEPGAAQFERFVAGLGIAHVPSRAYNPQTNGKLERLWLEYDRHRERFPSLQAWIDWNNDLIHDALWTQLYETPREAFQRKLPPEAILGLHERLAHDHLTNGTGAPSDAF